MFPGIPPPRSRRILLFFVASFAFLSVTGCMKPTGGGGSGGGGTKPADYVYLTGNWQFDATPTSGAAPFTVLAGFISEQDSSGTNDFTTAALQVQSTTCYSTAVEIPLQGGTEPTLLGLSSFPVDGQTLTLSATKDSTATHLTGKYTISGGCANGQSGTVAGTLYDLVNGTYAGSVTGAGPAENVQLNLTQGVGSGDGLSYIAGSAAFQGFPCFTTGNLPYAAPGQYFPGYVTGSKIYLDFTTNDANGSQIILSGNFDPTATTIMINSLAIIGGDCAQAPQMVSLTLTKS